MQKIIRRIIMTYIILVFTIIIYSFTNSDGLYSPLVYFMYVSPILIFLFSFNKFDYKEWYLWILTPFLLLQSVLNPSTFRISTVVYSLFFILVFILYQRLLRLHTLSLIQYYKLIKFIIYAYFVVLVVQQIQFILNLPIFNISWLGDSFKLNSLSYEPSYIAALLPLLIFNIIKINEIRFNKEFTINSFFKQEFILNLAFLYTIFTCGSTTAFFTFPIIMVYFFRKKISISSIFTFLITCLGAGFLISFFNPQLIERQLNLLPALLSSDVEVIRTTDGSASTRIVPFVLFIEHLKNIDINLFFGYGVDYAKELFSEAIFGDKERVTGSLGIVAFFLDYGLLAGIIFLNAIVKYTSKKLYSYENFFFLTSFLVFGFNHYLTWIYMISMSSIMYFKNIHLNQLKV